MKNATQILIGFLCCSYLTATGQLPYVQHPDPPGVIITSARMNDIAFDASNNKWIPFANYGIGVYDGTNWTMYNTANSGMPSDSTLSVDFDASGNAWIGTKAGAVYKSGSAYTLYNTANSGLPSDVVTRIYVNGNTTWFGTYQGLASYDGTTWTVFNTSNSGLVNDSITAIDIDANGVLWIGTRNGLNSYNGSVWTSYTTSNTVLNRFIIDVACDNAGRTWVSNGIKTSLQALTTTGVNFIQDGTVYDFKTDLYKFEMPVTYPTGVTLTTDIAGNVWFRANIHLSGMIKITGTAFSFYSLPSINSGVTSFGSHWNIDPNGILWTVPRFRFYFYSLDPSGYVQGLDAFNYENHRSIDINDVKAGINVMGDMHWDLSTGKYEVPKGSGKHSVFASALWIGGFDQGGQLHIAGQTYRQTGIDYWPGPISGISVPLDTAVAMQFNKIWKMDKWKIEEFKNQFAAGNVTNGTYPVPDEIATWPAKGNGIVVDEMAPYVDFNSNGSYNPMDGDYPLIKGDQMLYYIFNDVLNVHTETNGLPLGIEVHASAYAFNCSNIAGSDQVMNRTTLYHYDIINRSTTQYNDVYIGLWSDMDLGNALDDYVGCDSLLSAGFTYNGDNDDESVSGYGLNPPMQNVKVLRGTLADVGDGIDNDFDGTVDEAGERTSMNHFHYYNNVNNNPTGNPSTSLDFYNYMTSVWLNNMPVSNPSGDLTHFMFSGVPYSGTGWTEAGSGNSPEDRRFVMSSGGFTFGPGDTATMDFAYVFTWDSLSPNGLNTSIARNQADLQLVQSWFDNNNFPSCEVYTVGLNETETSGIISVYPNPVIDQLFIQSEPGSLYGRNYTVLNLLGEEITHGKFYSNSVPVSYLPPQVYVIKVEFDNGTEYAKFVKW